MGVPNLHIDGWLAADFAGGMGKLKGILSSRPALANSPDELCFQYAGKLAGKPFGIFTSTGTLGGGQEITPLTSLSNFVHHGMVYIPTVSAQHNWLTSLVPS